MRYFYFILLLAIGFSSNAQEITTFKKYDELEKYLEENKSQPLVVNFWATWCAPCIKELPYFEQLHNQNKAVKVITVSLDFEKDFETKLKTFLKKKKYTFITTFLAAKDYNNWISKVYEDWSGSIPATLIVNGDKRVFVESDFSSFEELNNHVNKSINQ